MFKIGIVGAGIIAKAHVDAIENNNACTLVAVADIVKERAEQIAEPHGALAFCDYHEMPKACELDAVIINLPHYLHCEASCFFLENGVSVFVEKPMAMTVEECDKMIQVAEENHKLLAIGHVQQYTKAHQYLKKVIETKQLGKLLRITEIRNKDYFTNRPAWFLDKNLSGGGIVMNYCAHTLDKIFYLTGSTLVDACSICTNHINDCDIEEGAQVLAKFSDGVSAVFSYTGSKGPYFYETFFYFEQGVMKVTHSSNLFVFENGEWKQLIADEGRMHDNAMEELVKALRGEPSMLTTAQYGRNVIAGITKIYQSSL